MRRGTFTALTVAGITLMLAGAAFAQTSPSTEATQPRPSIGQSTPGTSAPGTTMPGAAAPQTPTSTTSALPPAGDGQVGAGQVRSVQQALQSKGRSPGAIDGVVGPRTEEAFRTFQKEQNLPQTGRIDAQTLEKLGISPQ
jgi:peptidoglycan hydrolase-like protein with peptidoglycan-binding domain